MLASSCPVSTVAAKKVLLGCGSGSLATKLRPTLEEKGYQMCAAADGAEVMRRLHSWEPDLVILDTLMSETDVGDSCRQVRRASAVPIVMLTSIWSAGGEVSGLGDGADLYMAGPIPIPLLVARIEALLRRSCHAAARPRQAIITTGDLQVNLSARNVVVSGLRVDLSPTEFRLMAALATAAGHVVSHEELMARVWGPNQEGQRPCLKLYISYLRRKIERNPDHPTHILTCRGLGYYLNRPAPNSPLDPAPDLL